MAIRTASDSSLKDASIPSIKWAEWNLPSSRRTATHPALHPSTPATSSAITWHLSLSAYRQLDDSLARIRACPQEVWIVELADRTVNLQPPPQHWYGPKRRQYQAEAGRILVRVLGKKPEHTHVVIQEIAEEDWGFAGVLTDEWRRRQGR